MLLRLSRDSVAAGDDVESHDEDRVVDQRRPLERFVAELLRDGYLPSIKGGRATWIIRRARRGEAIGVVAMRFGRFESVRLVVGQDIDLAEVGDSLHFEYEAQRSPDEVLAALRSASTLNDRADDEHRIELIESNGGALRWVCSCGTGSGGRWYPSGEEAMKAAQRHLALP